MDLPPALGILADDLSGAADCAASFTGAAGAIALLLREDSTTPPRFALDADSRALDAAEAASAWRELGRRFGADHSTLLFKKIDSTLRGNIAEETSAFLESMADIERIVVAPAFPEQGRTFVEGRLHVHGKAQDADLHRLRERLDRVCAWRSLVMPMTIASQDDLLALARTVREAEVRTLWIGSSGLARALAGVPPRRLPADVLRPPLLGVVGSYTEVAREQVRAFARRRPGQAFAVSPHDASPRLEGVRSALRAEGRALVHFDLDSPLPPSAGSRAAVATLAQALRGVAPLARTLVLTGGDTARAVLEALGIDAFTIEGELEPGVAVSAPLEREGLRVVLKAGGFGDNGVFLRAIP